MIRKNFFAKWAATNYENNTLTFVNLGLSAALIISLLVINNLSNSKTVVVIPPNLNKEFQVSGNTLSKEYFEQVGFYLSDRILSVSPENVANSFDTILPYLATNPESIKTIRENLSLQAETIKQNDFYQVFYPMRVSINEQGMKFSVEGTLKKMSGNNSISSGRATVIYDFSIENGRLFIKNIEVK